MPEQIPLATGVLVWARESALASLADASARTGQPEDKIRDWEAGRSQPTYSQLERLADEYGVSVNVLLLPARPQVPAPPPDFRAAADAHDRLSRTGRRELRRARQLQALLSEVRVLPPPGLPTLGPGDQLATVLRAALGITMDSQVHWKSANAAFAAWRLALGRLGVLVLQHRLPDAELQGLSLPAANGGPPVIFLNQGDWINARIFTLLHELGHLVLARDGGICDPWHLGPKLLSESLEARCNRLAGAVLVPAEDLGARPEVHQIAGERDNDEVVRLLGALGNRYRVSGQVIWYRIRELGEVPDDRFTLLWPKLRHPVRRRRPVAEGEEGSGIPRWRLARSRYGGVLVDGLLTAVDRGAIEPTRMLRALGLGTGDLARLHGEPRFE